LISKDAIKEALFEAIGYGGMTWSKTVSRAADAAMVRIAQDLEGAVLDNFWYAETVDELLAPLPLPIVEVFCSCDPDVAYERFRRRVRHPGHADQERDPDTLRAPFIARAKKLPLRTLGPVVEVNTERPVDVGSVATRVVAASGA
jgi:thymidylate kinase